MPIKTLSERLQYRISKQGFDDTDKEWLLFLKDHKDQILLDSLVMIINDSKKTQYEYHLRWFLEDQGIRLDMLNVIMMLNNILQESDFVNIERLYIPNEQKLQELRTQYTQFKRSIATAGYTL